MLRGQYATVDAAIWDELEAEFMKTSMKVGEKWGQGVAENVLARLRENGY
ncbi:MAG: hypothetical protein AAF388_06625 [Bacteroidota bacterium]